MLTIGEEPAAGEWIYLRKNKKLKPKLRSINDKTDLPPEIVVMEPPKMVEVDPHVFPTEDGSKD